MVIKTAMKQFYEQIQKFLAQGNRIALATIVESRGSTPREVGAKMIIEERGQIMGTVGGGCGEAQVFQDALRVLQQDKPRFSCVDLTGEINENTATNCGGIMDVFIDSLCPKQPTSDTVATEKIVEAVLSIYQKRELAALITVLETGMDAPLKAGCKFLVKENGEVTGWSGDQNKIEPIIQTALSIIETNKSKRLDVTVADSKLDVFFEVITPPVEIVIVGAGHIAQPLSQLAKMMEFEVTIIDDRWNFANKSRFPEADRVIVGEIDEVIAGLPIGPATHIVLVTRGHQMDQAALLKVIGSRAAYIGMIGSKRRVGAVFTYLRENGITQELIDRVYAPIGIEIGAETPDEIAVSIMAEIIKLRRQGRASSISESRKRPAQLKSE